MGEYPYASLVWFRNDLRVEDNPALMAALECGRPIIPFYIVDQEGEGDHPPGKASRWWLRRSLARLDKELRGLGSRLVVRVGRTEPNLKALFKEASAIRIFWNERYEPHLRALDQRVTAAMRELGLEVHTFDANLLYRPDALTSARGEAYRLFTPYLRRYEEMPPPGQPLPAPPELPPVARRFHSARLADLDLLRVDSVVGDLGKHWQPGEEGAHTRLDLLIDELLTGYPEAREQPARDGTSRLSPHLHFGELSPRVLWHRLHELVKDKPRGKAAAGARAFLREYAWREFAAHVLFHYPDAPREPLDDRFLRFPWRSHPRLLRAWQEGGTGYPIVDAGIRQLRATGWLNVRVRRIVAAFLVRSLMVHWRDGMRFFWDHTVDADLAQNTIGWQSAAGCGADEGTFFHVPNPVSQGKRLDPGGEYVRRWIPALATVDEAHVHQPWRCPSGPPRRYPAPIVSHEDARNRALLAHRRFIQQALVQRSA